MTAILESSTLIKNDTGLNYTIISNKIITKLSANKSWNLGYVHL